MKGLLMIKQLAFFLLVILKNDYDSPFNVRDEANRLTEILRLKAARKSDDQEEIRNLSRNKHNDPCIVPSANELPRFLTEEKKENLSYATWEHVATTPVRRPTVSN